MKTAFLSFLLAAATSAGAATLSTGTTANNGSGGVFLTLTPTTQNLSFEGFSSVFGGTSGTSFNLEVWMRSGAYAGFTAANTGWTLVETLSGISAGTATETSLLSFSTPIELTAGQSSSFYFHSITAGSGIRYFGTGTTSNANYSNTDIALFTDTARTGNAAFAGAQFTPRAFVGTISYSVVPEPSSTLLFGAGACALALQRRHPRRS
jgi:hypothetical protein